METEVRKQKYGNRSTEMKVWNKSRPVVEKLLHLEPGYSLFDFVGRSRITVTVTVLINPRRACAARVTNSTWSVCLCVSVTQHLTFTCLFMPQTILTFLVADECRKF